MQSIEEKRRLRERIAGNSKSKSTKAPGIEDDGVKERSARARWVEFLRMRELIREVGWRERWWVMWCAELNRDYCGNSFLWGYETSRALDQLRQQL
jgi:hypothetical protein